MAYYVGLGEHKMVASIQNKRQKTNRPISYLYKTRPIMQGYFQEFETGGYRQKVWGV